MVTAAGLERRLNGTDGDGTERTERTTRESIELRWLTIGEYRIQGRSMRKSIYRGGLAAGRPEVKTLHYFISRPEVKTLQYFIIKLPFPPNPSFLNSESVRVRVRTWSKSSCAPPASRRNRRACLAAPASLSLSLRKRKARK